MLKPYKTRVTQTYELLLSVLDFTEKNSKKIANLRANAAAAVLKNETYPIAYTVDKENPTSLNFQGYEAKKIASTVTNGNRLFYDTTMPFTKEIDYYNTFLPSREVRIPKAYILKQGWHRVVDRLTHNNIAFTRFQKDTILTVDVQHIVKYKTSATAYEGHYFHSDTRVSLTTQKMMFSAGDLYISTQQNGIRYVLETLEAAATDSFFNWNFFDTILQQKEGYSSYVFEDIAEDILLQNPDFKELFEAKLKRDTSFFKNPKAQLDFIYKNSPYYEKAHLRLPIFKVF
jgi:hypothetical protein